MTPTDGGSDHELEWGWRLDGVDGAGEPIEITIGETELSHAEFGITVGRHAALCEYVIDDDGISHRHFRLSRGADGLLVEDVNSLNGTRLDGHPLAPFEPVIVRDGQRLTAGRVNLAIARLADPQ
jgi:pSer/pThr/pTyr-binding forkhead associated (FHA) protein